MHNDNHYINAGQRNIYCICGIPTKTGFCEHARVVPSNHFRDSGNELRYSKACSDNRCSECEWDANDCDHFCHFERERR